MNMEIDLPRDIVKSLLAIGPVEWGSTHSQSDELHVEDFKDTLRLTREHFGTTDDETAIHGVYLEGRPIVLAHTGTSPNSPQHARIIAGVWNALVEMAKFADFDGEEVQVSDAAPSSEAAVAIPSHGTAAGEAALGNASVASPLSHSDREC